MKAPFWYVLLESVCLFLGIAWHGPSPLPLDSLHKDGMMNCFVNIHKDNEGFIIAMSCHIKMHLVIMETTKVRITMSQVNCTHRAQIVSQ